MFAGQAAWAQSNLFEIVDMAYCRKILGNAAVEKFTGQASIARGEAVYCWTKIRVLPAGVEMLKREGRLPIRHTWLCNDNPVATAKEPTITPEQWEQNRDKLKWAIANGNGTFEWRTQSLVQRDARPGIWRVSVADGHGRLSWFRGGPILPSLKIDLR